LCIGLKRAQCSGSWLRVCVCFNHSYSSSILIHRSTIIRVIESSLLSSLVAFNSTRRILAPFASKFHLNLHTSGVSYPSCDCNCDCESLFPSSSSFSSSLSTTVASNRSWNHTMPMQMRYATRRLARHTHQLCQCKVDAIRAVQRVLQRATSTKLHHQRTPSVWKLGDAEQRNNVAVWRQRSHSLDFVLKLALQTVGRQSRPELFDRDLLAKSTCQPHSTEMTFTNAFQQFDIARIDLPSAKLLSEIARRGCGTHRYIDNVCVSCTKEQFIFVCIQNRPIHTHRWLRSDKQWQRVKALLFSRIVAHHPMIAGTINAVFNAHMCHLAIRHATRQCKHHRRRRRRRASSILIVVASGRLTHEKCANWTITQKQFRLLTSRARNQPTRCRLIIHPWSKVR
jgi:hypothetical protein